MKPLLIAEVVFIFSCFVFLVALFILIQESLKHFYNTRKGQRNKHRKNLERSGDSQKKYVLIKESVHIKEQWN